MNYSRTKKTGALLVNLGTPDAPTVSAVRDYLREFLLDPYVVDLPEPMRSILVRGIILPLRPKKSAHAYSTVWTEAGSPLLVHGEGLRDAVRARVDFPVELGMRYGRPSIRSGLEALRDQGVERVIVLPLYPQFAGATTASSEVKVRAEASAVWSNPDLEIIPPFHGRPEFIACFAAVAAPVIAAMQPDHVLFSYHGLPERQIKKGCSVGRECLRGGDACQPVGESNALCYRAHCFATTRDLLAALKWPADRATTSFQSRLGLARWTHPYTEQTLRELPTRGAKRLVVLSPAFVADCLETIEEIGDRGRESFLESGGTAFQLVPSLNTEPAWADAVAGWLRDAAHS